MRVRVAILHLQLVSIWAAHAIRTQVEIAELLAGVIAAVGSNLKVLPASIAVKARAVGRVDVALAIAALFLTPGSEKYDWMILAALHRCGSCCLTTLHTTASAYIVVTVLIVAAEVAIARPNARPAQVTVHNVPRHHLTSAKPWKRACFVDHCMSSVASLVCLGLVILRWSGLILLLLISLKLRILSLELGYSLLQ